MRIPAHYAILFCLLAIGCGNGNDKLPTAVAPPGSEPAVQPANAVAGPSELPPGAAATGLVSGTSTTTPLAPGLLAREFTWQKGEPPVTMIHRDDGFAFLTGFRGQLAPPVEVGAVMDADGDWILSGTTDQSQLIGNAFAIPWFVEIQKPVEFKTWQVPRPDFPRLIHQRDGFCVLLMVGGHFRGAGEQFRLRVDDEGYWRLNARSQSGRTQARAMVVKVPEPGSFHGIVREHHWQTNDGRGAIPLIHSADGFAFLSGLSGSFIDDREFARVTLEDDGYWYLDGRSHDGEAHAWATSIQLTGTETPLIAATGAATNPPGTQPESPPAAESDAPTTAQARTIYGEWEIVGALDNGIEDEDLVGDLYVFSEDGRELAMHLDGSRSSINTFRLGCKIDPSLKHVEYAFGGDSMLGVYKLEDNRLMICFNINERPGEFTSTSDNENRLLVLQRPSVPGTAPTATPTNDGWTDLLSGPDLADWKGFVGSPLERSQMSAAELSRAQAAADRRMREHWKLVDGVLEFDGQGDNLCTARDYDDFELSLEWKIGPGGDSGVYLRGCPQVQIWDTASGKPNANRGSGGLYNNQSNPRWPDVKTDSPVGEWNTFFIRMVGDRVTVDLNDQCVVNDVVMENHFEQGRSIYPTGPIELQKFGERLWFRNIRIRELTPTRPTAPGTPMTSAEALAALEEIGFEFSEDDGLEAMFAGDELTDDGLAPFQYLPEIRTIALGETPITDAGLEYLTGLENLKNLDLESTAITDEGLRLVGQMTNLEGLSVSFCENVTVEGLNHLRPLKGLSFLAVHGYDIGPGGLQFAREMVELEMFAFFSGIDGLADSDFRVIGGMTKLTDLDLSGETGLNDNTIRHLAGLKELVWLNLDFTDVGDRAMETVAGFPRLQGLELHVTEVGDDGMEHLSQLTELHTIDLTYTDVTPRGLAALKDCPMSQLIFSGPHSTDRHLSPLRQWRELTILDLSGEYSPDDDRSIPNEITLRGIRTLSEFDQLEELRLSDNPQITDAAVPYLSKLKNLYALELTGTGITSEGGQAIAEAIDGLEFEDLGIQ